MEAVTRRPYEYVTYFVPNVPSEVDTLDFRANEYCRHLFRHTPRRALLFSGKNYGPYTQTSRSRSVMPPALSSLRTRARRDGIPVRETPYPLLFFHPNAPPPPTTSLVISLFISRLINGLPRRAIINLRNARRNNDVHFAELSRPHAAAPVRARRFTTRNNSII